MERSLQEDATGDDPKGMKVKRQEQAGVDMFFLRRQTLPLKERVRRRAETPAGARR